MQFLNFSDDATLPRLCKWQILCHLWSVQLVIVQTRCDLKPFAHFERERERVHGDSQQTVCGIMSHRKFSNYFISYLMKKYELYLTFSIIIILPAPDRDRDGAAACRAKPLTAGASSAWDRFFEIGLFRDRRSNIPKRLSADSDW